MKTKEICVVNSKNQNLMHMLDFKNKTYHKPCKSFFPRPDTWLPDEVQNFPVEIDIPTLVGDGKRKCDGRVGFRHIALVTCSEKSRKQCKKVQTKEETCLLSFSLGQLLDWTELVPRKKYYLCHMSRVMTYIIHFSFCLRQIC